MSSATDTDDRIRRGFAELLATLRDDGADQAAAVALKAELDTAARKRSLARVREEYRALGLYPSSQYTLSITAITELGYQMPTREQDDNEDAA